MMQQFLAWLHTIGLPGLFFVMFLEGSSLPFPGLIMVLSYGYILSAGYAGTAFIALGMSIFYTLASLIPYFLGMKMGDYFSKRLEKGWKKAQYYFNKYGIWTIALSRPFGIGNYISYIAGISNVNLYKYIFLTFIGIYPWSYVMLLLGQYFKGNYEVMKNYFGTFSIYGYGAAIVIGVIILFYYRKMKLDRREISAGDGGGNK